MFCLCYPLFQAKLWRSDLQTFDNSVKDICCAVTPLSKVRGGLGPQTCLTRYILYVLVPSQEPVIQWLLFFAVDHICFLF